MHSQSTQPCRRERLLSALKLSDKPKKDLGISSSNYALSKACEMDHSIPCVKTTLDQCDPLVIALARSTNTLTSHRYACQRSTTIRVPAGFPTNQNFSQRVIYTFENLKDEAELDEFSRDEDISWTSIKFRIGEKEQKPSKAIDLPQLEMPEFPSPLLKSEFDLIHWSSSTPIRVQRRNHFTPPSSRLSKGSSILTTPNLTSSSSSGTRTVGSTFGSSFTTPSLTSSSRSPFSTGPSLITPKWPNKKKNYTIAKPINKLYTIHEGLLSPSRLPSPGPVKIEYKHKSDNEILAGLEFLNRFYGEL
ncbi:hypothetical protein DFH28DRAFT_15052 [Melampsora americana]|nr:hypothetical protein DFH28DRAFT_15052 [Melampsora americana]